MRHVRIITLSKAQEDGDNQWENMAAILNLVFGFILDLAERKGKGDNVA